MRFRRLSILLIAWILSAANIRLYMKDGSWHLVREYKAEADRVRYYSTERGDWEEIPLDLVDLKRTENEIRDRAESDRQEAAANAVEEKAEREAAREVARVPEEVGVFYVDGKELKPLKLGESKVVTNKRRSVLKALSPIPMVSGKATLELDGLSSAFTVASDTPEFYFRLSQPERFGMIKLTPTKENRVIQRLTIVPVSKEVVEEQDDIEIFRRQVGDQLYKIWPQKPLEAGEYAIVEYTQGKSNIQVYDFSYKTGKEAAAAPAPSKETKERKPASRKKQ